jgi:hypothetical protein
MSVTRIVVAVAIVVGFALPFLVHNPYYQQVIVDGLPRLRSMGSTSFSDMRVNSRSAMRRFTASGPMSSHC